MALTSIIIPVYNEEKTIGTVLRRCLSLDIEKEIIVVDNGSTDLSSDIVLDFANKYKEIIYLFELLKGKGNAIRRGLKYARGSYIVFHDADVKYCPEAISSIVKLLENYDIVYGVRVGRLYSTGVFPYIANKMILRLVNYKFKSNLFDVFTGQRGYRKSVLDHMKWFSAGFNVDAELTMLALREGYSYCNLDIPYSPMAKQDDKKIGFINFLSVLMTFVRFSWNLR